MKDDFYGKAYQEIIQSACHKATLDYFDVSLSHITYLFRQFIEGDLQPRGLL